MVHLRNFAVQAMLGWLLLLGMYKMSQYIDVIHQNIPGNSPSYILLKLLLKVMPVAAAFAAEFMLCARGDYSLRWLLRQEKSSVIDLYCYLLSHVQAVMTILTIIFTFSVPYFVDAFLTAYFPKECSVFLIIAKQTNLGIATCCFFAFASFVNYWEHRLWHTKVFWPIHRFHHSATEFTILTNIRNHFTEGLLSPFFFTLPLMLMGAPAAIVNVIMAINLFQGFITHMRGEISYGWIGKYLWCDPVFHKIHHSLDKEHINKNFSGALPIWDVMFGTYAPPKDKITVGVSDGQHYEELPLWRMYIKDFSDFLRNMYVYWLAPAFSYLCAGDRKLPEK